MILKKLYLKNFKHIKEAEFNFNKRINLFSGDPGQGKTSIFEAIRYLYTNDLDGKISEYINWDPKVDEFIIKSKSTNIDGTIINYDIRVTKNKTEKILTLNDSKENIFYNSDATKKMAEILNPLITNYSAISEQEKTSALIFEKPTARLEKFKKIVGVDKLQLVTAEMKLDVDVKKSQIEKLKIEVQTLESLIYDYHDIPKIEDITDLKVKFEKLQKEEIDYKNKLKLWEEYVQNNEKYIVAKKDIDFYNNKVIELNESIQNIDSQYKNFEDISKEEYSNLLSQIEKLDIEIGNIEKHKILYVNYIRNRNEYDSELEKIENNLKNYKLFNLPELSFTSEEYNLLKKSESELKKEIVLLSSKLKAIQDGKCPTCGAEYDTSEIEQLSIKLMELDNNLEVINKKINNFNEEMEKLKDLEKELEFIKVKIEDIKQSKSSIISKIRRLENIEEPDLKKLRILKISKEGLSNKIKELDDKLTEIEKIKKYNDELNNKKKKFQDEKIFIASKIEELEKIKKPEEVKKLKFDINELENIKEKIVINKQLEKEAKRIEDINKETRKNEIKNNKKINDKKKEIEEYEKEIRILNESKKIIDKKFSSYLVDKGAKFIKTKMNEFFTKAYGRYQVTFAQDKSSIDFFYSKDGGEELRSVTLAGGHEKKLLGTSNRIALCAMQNLEFMLLDEIDNNSPPEYSIKLFKSLLEENFKQLFIITHVPETQDFFINSGDCSLFEIKKGILV